MMITHLVFDFGGVILDLDGVHTGYPHDLAEIFHLPLQLTQEVWAKNKTRVITGQESPREFLERMKGELKLDFDVDTALKF